MFELADGVTGNTSGFGPEESRFEPWSANKSSSMSCFFFALLGKQYFFKINLLSNFSS